ncbi:UNVERIFIED_CONTAM: Pentatricopeptide repeat-containing protein [Sesamum radiatum]|uniref:Pentatricopeptide repeat-containing protein n=1 Tax=Sesamum radiatum TaxID=300843 RepID=A0AAW2KBW5_SESRA
MLDFGVEPNEVTYIAVLLACSHACTIDKGRHFDMMYKEHGIKPRITLCMHGRYIRKAGFLDKAIGFNNSMLFTVDTLVQRMLLRACCVHGTKELGKHAVEMILEQDPNDPTSHVLLSSLYAYQLTQILLPPNYMLNFGHLHNILVRPCSFLLVAPIKSEKYTGLFHCVYKLCCYLVLCQSCTKSCSGLCVPDNVQECIRLTQEFRLLPRSHRSQSRNINNSNPGYSCFCPMLQFPWSEPSNKYVCVGNLLCSIHIYIWLGAVFVSDWEHADIGATDISAVYNTEIRGDEGEKTRDAEQWMSHRLLPDSLRERIRRCRRRLQDGLAKGGSSSRSSGATIYASGFAANALTQWYQKDEDAGENISHATSEAS